MVLQLKHRIQFLARCERLNCYTGNEEIQRVRPWRGPWNGCWNTNSQNDRWSECLTAHSLSAFGCSFLVRTQNNDIDIIEFFMQQWQKWFLIQWLSTCLPKRFGSFCFFPPVCCMALADVPAILANPSKYEKNDHLFRIRDYGFVLFMGCVKALDRARYIDERYLKDDISLNGPGFIICPSPFWPFPSRFCFPRQALDKLKVRQQEMCKKVMASVLKEWRKVLNNKPLQVSIEPV